MIYTVNIVLHSLHTIKPGSTLEQKIQAKNANFAQIGGHKHRVCKTATEAKTIQAMLILHGNQS